MGTSRSDFTNQFDSSQISVKIEPHGKQTVSWRQTHEAGSRDDRMLREISVSLPPKISGYHPVLTNALNKSSEDALRAVTRLDSRYGHNLEALSALLLRSESVASSKIEYIEATMDDFARAAHGMKSNPSAVSMVAATNAINELVSSANDHHDIQLEQILTAHRLLMADDEHEAIYGGQLRTVQNWIGGSDFAPRNTLYTPPPPEMMAEYMDDLLGFVNRDDIPAMTQAAIAHAQFESIHPFNDGNGRIGRALINAVLRRRGVTSGLVVPIATALVANRQSYFDVLTAYRHGNAGPIIAALVVASEVAAHEALQTAELIKGLPDMWLDLYVNEFGRAPRADSAVQKIVQQLLITPFFTAEEIGAAVTVTTAAIYNAISRLEQAGVIRSVTHRKRNQVWCASAIIDELNDLGQRVAAAVR